MARVNLIAKDREEREERRRRTLETHRRVRFASHFNRYSSFLNRLDNRYDSTILEVIRNHYISSNPNLHSYEAIRMMINDFRYNDVSVPQSNIQNNDNSIENWRSKVDLRTINRYFLR